MKAPFQRSFAMPTDLTAIDAARRWAGGEARGAGIAEAAVADLEVAMTEALSNVVRHAHAEHATVTLTAGDSMHLVVEDDGSGAKHFAREGGHGVANLVERARQLGGTASVGAVTPHGTRVDWRVPLAPAG